MIEALLGLAEQRGLTVEWRDLGPRNGEYSWPGLIVINPKRTAIAQYVTLAHELGHAHHAHVATEDVHLHARQERLADEFAARLLVCPARLAEAEALVGPHPGALAKELGVTRRMVEVFYEHLGRHTVAA